MIKTINNLEKTIGLKFKNRQLLLTAFVHRSYLNEHKNSSIQTNEKLEFLGDSVLSMITSVYLYKNYPNFSEGEYTDIKAAIVNTNSLGQAAKQLNLGEYLLLSKGEKDNNGQNNISILADCFEALIAAIYLEFGFNSTAQFIDKFLFKNNIDAIIKNKMYLPAKNLLQEYYQNKYKKLPDYKIISEKGPQHDKNYVIGIFQNNKLIAKGFGKSKKKAEEKAAHNALKKIKI